MSYLLPLPGVDFEKPDMDTFYGLALAYEAGRCGGTLPTVFNAANELAVSQFLNREIKYLEITEIIEDCMKALLILKRMQTNTMRMLQDFQLSVIAQADF